jgi:replicative DNA helicase Mcm
VTPTDPSIEAAWRSFFEANMAEEVASLADRYPEERSAYVDVVDLHRHDPDLVEALFAEPTSVLRWGAEVLREDEPSLGRVNLRVRNHPSLLGIGSVRSRHLTKLVTVEGTVDAVGPVEARAAVATFVCGVCGAERREYPREVGLSAPVRCPECALTDTLSLDHRRSTFVDVQRITLREAIGVAGDPPARPGIADPSGTVTDGAATARTMTVSIDDDLVGTASVGDHLRVTGVVRLDRHGEENRFAFSLDGVAVDERRPGRTDSDGEADVPERLKEAIRARWESVVDG